MLFIGMAEIAPWPVFLRGKTQWSYIEMMACCDYGGSNIGDRKGWLF